MIVASRFLTLIAFATLGACAIEPSGQQSDSNAAKVEDSDPHPWPREDASADAEASESRVRTIEASKSRVRTNKADNKTSTPQASPAKIEDVPVAEEVKPEPSVEETPSTPAPPADTTSGPIVTFPTNVVPQNFNLLSSNTISVPVTSDSAGTVQFSIDRSALDLVDMNGDVSIVPMLPSLTFTAPGQSKMLELKVDVSSKSPALSSQAFTVIATSMGQNPVEALVSLNVSQRLDIKMFGEDPNNPVGDTANQNLMWSSNGQTIDIRNGTIVSFTNMDPNNGLVVHMNGGFHGDTGNPIPTNQAYTPGDICGASGSAALIFYDHNREGGIHQQTINCMDNQ